MYEGLGRPGAGCWGKTAFHSRPVEKRHAEDRVRLGDQGSLILSNVARAEGSPHKGGARLPGWSESSFFLEKMKAYFEQHPAYGDDGSFLTDPF